MKIGADSKRAIHLLCFAVIVARFVVVYAWGEFELFGGLAMTLSHELFAPLWGPIWRHFLDHPGGGEIPLPRPKLSTVSKLAVDRGLIAMLSGSAGFWVRPGDVDPWVQREVQRAVELYSANGWLDDPQSFHATPPELRRPRFKKMVNWIGYEHMRWSSGYSPRAGDPGRRRWLGYERNRTAHAWVMRYRDEDRPWVVDDTRLSHGASDSRLGSDQCALPLPHTRGECAVLCHAPARSASLRQGER